MTPEPSPKTPQEETTFLTPSPAGATVFARDQIVAGRYRIVRFLGRGGMGEVYEAEDRHLPEMREHVALKTLLPSIASDQGMLARFRQEIALSRKVQHPNVCAAYDLALDDVPGAAPVWFLTMPLVEGETLSARLKREGRMAAHDALLLLEQMASALDAAHAAGIVHRDFKPSNVMLAGDRVVVSDFGLARRLAGAGEVTDTVTGQVMGTLDYMAPELLTGAAASASSDIYALGMTAYRMLTGVLPFEADTPLAGVILRSKQAVPAPSVAAPGLPGRWDRAILRALDANPSRRYARAGDFVRDLGGDTATVTVTLPNMTRARIAAIAGVAALAIAAWFGWREWNYRRSLPPADAQAMYRAGVDDMHAGAWFAAAQALERAAQRAPRFALAHARLADALIELDRYELAGEQMLEARRQDLSMASEADRRLIDAIDQSITRDYKTAAAKYEEIASSSRTNDAEIDLARAYEKADQPDKAIAAYRKVAGGAAPSPAAWLRLGVLLTRQSKAAEADRAFAQAEQLYKLTSNLEGLTETALQEGIAANTRGHLDEGAAFLKKALETAKLAGNYQQEVVAEQRLSTNAYMSGDAEAAENYARAAFETSQQKQLPEMEIRVHINLGNVFFLRRDFAPAERDFNEALAISRQNRSPHLIALSLVSMASLHQSMRRAQEALREAQQALEFYQRNRYSKETIQCLTLIARVKRDSGDYAGALASSRDLLEMAEKTQDRAQIALAHESLGSLMFNHYHFPEALEEYRKDLALAQDNLHIGFASQQVSDASWRLGDYANAEAALAKAEEVGAKFPTLAVNVRLERAQILLSQNRYAEAASAAREAMEGDKAHAAAVQSVAKEVQGLAAIRQGRKGEGRKQLEDALRIAEGLPDVDALLDARAAAMEGRVENGDRAGALELFGKMESQLTDRAELRWRMLALAARADSQYAARAAEALNALRQEWGAAAFDAYAARPDIQKLARGVSAAR